ncbi:AMP-binding protein [Azospirillum sp. TSO22-1]|uniref:AMP-binding protein n=1 Tax=Azospirillum sp. TSO22-1 TaxID=716789 RepID=UPI000D64151B|nr:AMP-binding protein [Azospirillum sp. TSO22-1]
MIAKALLRALFRLAYRVEVRGLENARAAGVPAIVVANPQSRLDTLLIAAFLPDDAVLAVDPRRAGSGWVWRILGLFDTVRLAPENPCALRTLVKAVRSGRRCVIFPQGVADRAEDLPPVYGAPALVAHAADAPVLPVRIDGAVFTPFSLFKKNWPSVRWFPKIALTVLPARRLTVDPALRGRARRQALAGVLYDVMADAALRAYDRNRSVFDALLDARSRFGYGVPILNDAERQPLTYGRLVLASVALGRALTRLSAGGEVVGVLLPNANAVAVTLFGLQAFGRVPALLNYSMGPDALVSACATARVRTVLTSRRFIALGRLERIAEALAAHTRLVYLEDVRKEVGTLDKLWGLAVSRLPGLMRGRTAKADAPAAVLFTSGSEGTPKGVVLSHANFLSNVAQIAAVVDLWPTDRVVNPLPVFHSFGLTAGLLLPLLLGVPTCFYPSPLHYRAVAELVAELKATILFATDTFLTGYARAASDGELSSLRYAVAGAEAVRENTRRLYQERFGVLILEGYGATETTPVMAVNTPTHARPDTVGRFLPGMENRLEPVQGVHEGGQLFVRGPNVMLGYYLSGQPAQLIPPPEGWHDTGDIVVVDADGYACIVGRVKRFAKLGGEMVSLAGVEAHAAKLWPDDAHAAVALPDTRKGERIVLLTSRAGAHREEFLAFTRAHGIPELMVPKTVLWVEAIPTMGSGKADYPAVKRMAENALKETGAKKPA